MEVCSTILDAASPMPSDLNPQSACLVVIYGDPFGQRLALSQDPLIYGRDETCDIQLDDDRVSRRHAQTVWGGRGFLVEDLGSTNGTFVNNAAIDRCPLNSGDQLKMGHTIFKFLYGETAEEQYRAVIYELMTSDALTKAQNRRCFEESLHREISRSRRYRRPLALILFDIDHFQSLNDEHGHMAGDEVLRQLGALVQQCTRREDVFGRIGGEEFALLVPEASLREAHHFGDRLRQLIEHTAFAFEGTSLRVTCSFGISELEPNDGPTERMASQLLQGAERRLNAAKSGGRNRVVADG